VTASLTTGSSVEERRRNVVRYAAAGISAATAALYFGIGIGVLEVVDEASAKADGGMLTFGAAAGSAFVLGAILLVLFDHRGLWLLGAVLQIGVLVMYVAVSPQRTPPFELWGIVIKVLQAAILVALVYLLLHVPPRRMGRAWRPSR
jgi:hypothetical protein